MADYRIIKYCRMCKKRYIVEKGESKKDYCDECRERFLKQKEKERLEKEKKENEGKS
jgi:hypothetical protein